MISIQTLSKTYKKQKVLQEISFRIPEGSLFSILGPNGSGKTTLLKSILGTVLADQGSEIIVRGHSIHTGDLYKREVNYLPQFPRFPPHLKVKEMISLLKKLRRQRAIHQELLVEELKIGPFWNKAFGDLSGGMIQKVNILQCFMFDNPIFILDEPTQGLDPQITYFLKKRIKQEHTAGKTIVFTSHIMSEVEELAEQMALLVEGKLHALLSPDELKKEKQAETLEEALHQFWKVA